MDDRYRCSLCHEEFDCADELLAHKEEEDETIYVLDYS